MLGGTNDARDWNKRFTGSASSAESSFYFFPPCHTFRMADYTQELKQFSTANEMVNMLLWRAHVMFVTVTDDASAREPHRTSLSSTSAHVWLKI